MSRVIAPLKAEVIQEARVDQLHSRERLDQRVGGSFSQETLATMGSDSPASSPSTGATSRSPSGEAGPMLLVVDSVIKGQAGAPPR